MVGQYCEVLSGCFYFEDIQRNKYINDVKNRKKVRYFFLKFF